MDPRRRGPTLLLTDHLFLRTAINELRDRPDDVPTCAFQVVRRRGRMGFRRRRSPAALIPLHRTPCRSHFLLGLVEATIAVFVAVDHAQAMLRFVDPEVEVGGVAGQAVGAPARRAFEHVGQRGAQSVDVGLLGHGSMNGSAIRGWPGPTTGI